jgi:hypothetical protein
MLITSERYPDYAFYTGEWTVEILACQVDALEIIGTPSDTEQSYYLGTDANIIGLGAFI